MTSPSEETPPLKVLLTQLDWNLQWLHQMEKNERTDYYRDAALQRFGFAFDSAVKCIRAAAEQRNRGCPSSEECFELAETLNWLPEGAEWRKLIQDHQALKSESEPRETDAVFDRLKSHRNILKILFDRLVIVAQSS
ncbi:MAG: hypothetical protein GWM98_28430 [Nitrospinaceae bacterium]|nr:hypothetical protein [Nitrospinaceae bacterium]NIR57658.1 hypothetical protein [Nitrospinaceae bacterium]NIS88133.1 hypothetical protein [Nitrospinaceae bacterium]NIT85000.1 hypothetical protein [Nitrospinaceae bacterium]NIU47169.1 hypothetical protein [Nitrospinaceae bacterium]